jgi:Flp pilus assembly protein TadB
MKDETPFNPLLPSDLKLDLQGSSSEETGDKPKRRRSTSVKKKGQPLRQPRLVRKVMKNRKFNWEELRLKLDRKLAHLDRETLRKVLLACGLAASAVAAVLLFLKLSPAGMLLLLILGAGACNALWQRVRWFRISPPQEL